jgi:hypothetical protein
MPNFCEIRDTTPTVILLHDTRKFDVENLQSFIDAINQLSKREKVPVEFATMSELTKGIKLEPGFFR